VFVWPDLSIVVEGLGVASDGSVYMAGRASEGEEPGNTTADLFLRKVDAEGEASWQVKWGSDAGDSVGALGLDAEGNVYVAGFTAGELEEGGSVSGTDSFVTKWSPDGDALWTTQYGGQGADPGLRHRRGVERFQLLGGESFHGNRPRAAG
jgi:hypothetical protein